MLSLRFLQRCAAFCCHAVSRLLMLPTGCRLYVQARCHMSIQRYMALMRYAVIYRLYIYTSNTTGLLYKHVMLTLSLYCFVLLLLSAFRPFSRLQRHYCALHIIITLFFSLFTRILLYTLLHTAYTRHNACQPRALYGKRQRRQQCHQTATFEVFQRQVARKVCSAPPMLCFKRNAMLCNALPAPSRFIRLPLFSDSSRCHVFSLSCTAELLMLKQDHTFPAFSLPEEASALFISSHAIFFTFSLRRCKARFLRCRTPMFDNFS